MKTKTRIVMGKGTLGWERSERVSDRYGLVKVFNESGPNSLKDRPPLGQYGTLIARVIEGRESSHIGDFFRGLRQRNVPKDGQEIILGQGKAYFESFDDIGIEPDDGRTSDWLISQNLYQAHDCLVELVWESDMRSQVKAWEQHVRDNPPKRVFAAIGACLLLAGATLAGAQGVMPPGVTDTATGLHWLPPVIFNGDPLANVQFLLNLPDGYVWGTNTYSLAGYQLASGPQVLQLFRDMGIPLNGFWPVTNAAAIHPFLKAMDPTALDYTEITTWGYPGCLGSVSDGSTYGLWNLSGSGIVGYYVMQGERRQGPNYGFPGIGAWVYTTIPEPATGKLVIGGLVLWGMLALSVLGGRKGKK